MNSQFSLSFRFFTAAAVLFVFNPMIWGAPQEEISVREAIAALQARIERQEKQIDALTQTVAAQQQALDRIRRQPGPAPLQAVSTSLESVAGAIPIESAEAPASAGELAVVEAVQQQQNTRVDDLEKKLDTAIGNLGGFRLSGDFRFRLDGQLRSGNDVAPPLQNVRSRYRLRLNADKELDPRFRVHVQLSTSPVNNAITNDQDMAGMVMKHPFFIAEAYADYHPTAKFSIRGGRMEEVFADTNRFLWDDDVRFNGFQQILTIPFKTGAIKSLEFRSGEYFLSNPNVAILAAGSPFTSAGYQVGQKVRDANLFHPGVLLRAASKTWAHLFDADIQLYRNANQIQLASTAAGGVVLINNAIGLTLSSGLTGTGNATTTPGGAIYAAPHFQIARLNYRATANGLKLGQRAMPFYIDLQASRNVGTHKFRDAYMTTLNLGAVRNPGDVRFLYQYGVKAPNALISQFTDDDLGTGTGVNIRVHAVRADVGLTRFLQWQNLFFVQNELYSNSPAEQFFVPLQKGARPTFRYLGQLSFTF